MSDQASSGRFLFSAEHVKCGRACESFPRNRCHHLGMRRKENILDNLRIEVGRNSQPRVNREMRPLQGSDRPSIPEARGKPGPFRTQLKHPWKQVAMASASKGLVRHR